jgi:hypothetical protein
VGHGGQPDVQAGATARRAGQPQRPAERLGSFPQADQPRAARVGATHAASRTDRLSTPRPASAKISTIAAFACFATFASAQVDSYRLAGIRRVRVAVLCCTGPAGMLELMA